MLMNICNSSNEGKVIRTDYKGYSQLRFLSKDNEEIDKYVQSVIRDKHRKYIQCVKERGYKITLLSLVDNYEILLFFAPKDEIISEFQEILEYILV
jgi:hypothetical protein